MAHPALIFLSGRMLSLVVLLAFQIMVARILPEAHYAAYALVFAFATLIQTVVSFGAPRVISKYVSQAGTGLPGHSVRRLLLVLLALRLIASALAVAGGLAIAAYLGWQAPGGIAFSVAASLYILVGVVQIDADGAAQALGLQRVSRKAMVTEAVARLILVGGLLAVAPPTAAVVIGVSAATLAMAGMFLLIRVFAALAGLPAPARPERLDRADLRRTAAGGYAGTLAWFASSPAIIRLIAGAVLTLPTFAGFAFAQSLVVSFQRYTPGAMLYPFVEPTIMRNHARDGDRRAVEAGLALVPKVDMILLGAAVCGAIPAADAVVGLITGGRYADAAWAVPWVLVYVMTVPLFRSLEIAAVTFGAASALGAGLVISLFWGGAAVAGALSFGLIALLVCPVADAMTRIAWLWRAMARRGLPGVIDVPVLVRLSAAMVLCGCGGLALVRLLVAGPVASIAAGVLSALLYLACVVWIRPLSAAEADLIRPHATRRWMQQGLRLLSGGPRSRVARS